QTAREVDEEVRRIIQEAFDRAYQILTQNKTRLIMISERLIKEETLEGPAFESLFNQPIDNDQYEMPSILAGLANGNSNGAAANGNQRQSMLLPESGSETTSA
ncbi:MAG TPA: hypothetical protein VNE61_03705, partial [Ktedonobacteraceae bacterium]|nr:hypothetical protein [Ktedonobacteraceae bacterium]